MAIAPRVDPSPEVPVGPGGRFRILDPGPQWTPRAEYPDDPQGEPAFDGSGLVLDTKTGLKWTRFCRDRVAFRAGTPSNGRPQRLA